MTGSLRLSALLLLLLSRWAYADLEKGEDEYVRSWVIIEEQLVPPSRDELLAAGGGTAGGGSVGSAGAGRRITPKSVFVAPSFNKCSDGYRPDSMGRCVKVVKLNQAAQWDFLLKQLNSMYGTGAAGGAGGFPMSSVSAFQSPAITTTTVEPSLQKTDSPGPFQLNIPLVGGIDISNQTIDSIDEQFTITSTSASGNTTITDDDDVTTNSVSTIATDEDVDAYLGDHTTDVSITATDVTTDITRPRPYRNRHQTQTDDNAITVTSTYESTTIATDTKTKYVNSIGTSINGRTDDSLQSTKATIAVIPSSSSLPKLVTTTAVGVTEKEEQITTTVSTPITTEAEEEDVVTVLAMTAAIDGNEGVALSSSTPLPSTTTWVPYTTSNGGRIQHLATDTATPEYYDDQPEEPTSAPKVDCSTPNAYLYYSVCASLRQHQQLQQQQFQQIQQQQLLFQQHQQQQQQQLYQQQQQFYHQQQMQQLNHVATALIKRPTPDGSVQVRFPEEEDSTSVASAVAEKANLVRFPGLAPYRTTNKMYESSRHPTWWPTGWPEQQQQSEDTVHSQHHQHRIQHHVPQQKQEVRLWEFGSKLPKTTTTTAVISSPPPQTQWFRRFF